MTHIIMIHDDDLAPSEEIANGRLQLFMFSANWCGPCKAMTPMVEDIAESYADEVAVAKIDVERSAALAERFHIRMVPALVLYREGQEIARHTGSMNRTRLSLMLDDAIGGGAA